MHMLRNYTGQNIRNKMYVKLKIFVYCVCGEILFLALATQTMHTSSYVAYTFNVSVTVHQ